MTLRVLQIVFTLGLCLASVTASLADDPAPCAADMKKIIDNRSEATRILDHESSRDSMTQPDPVSGVTCMDQAVRVSARLGKIYSDKPPENVPAANTRVFTEPLAYPSFGVDKFLIQRIQDVVVPPLESHLDNLPGGLGAAQATSFVSSVITDLIGQITGPLNSITSFITSITSDIDDIMSKIDLVETVAAKLSLPLPSIVMLPVFPLIKTAQNILNTVINTLTNKITSMIPGFVNDAMSHVEGPESDMACDNVKKIWNDDDPLSGPASIQGDGISIGSASSQYKLNGYLGDDLWPIDAEPDPDFPFQSGDGSDGDAQIIYKSVENSHTLLTGPTAGLSSWKAPPTLTPDMDPMAIRGQF